MDMLPPFVWFGLDLEILEYFPNLYLLKYKVVKMHIEGELKDRVVGFLGHADQPKKYAEIQAIAKSATARGISFAYLGYEAVLLKGNRVAAFVFRDGKWKEQLIQMPTFLDCFPPRTYSQKYKFSRFNEKTFVAGNTFGGKEKSLCILAGHANSKKFVPAFEPLTEVALKEHLICNKKVVIKPFISNQGRNVFIVSAGVDGKVSLIGNGTKEYYEMDDLKSLVTRKGNKRFMIQQFVQSTTPEGAAFDLRAPVFRGKNGGWTIPRIYARCGSSEITSNLATGGQAHDAQEFLSTLYGGRRAVEIMDKVTKGAIEVAEVMQSNYPFTINSLGCDFGIQDGEPFIFEVNSFPGIKGCLEQAVPVIVDYYETMLKKISGDASISRNDRSIFSMHPDVGRS